ncbi:MAG: T9SS type A sorting domain-containing protein [Ignavibacteriaceae bacterium]
MCFFQDKTLAHSIVLIAFLLSFQVFGQPEVVDAVHLKQISSFATDYSIIDMKMSADGSTIVFATGGSQVKVYTMNTLGQGLELVYDFQTTGFGPFIDISADGNKVLWTWYGQIYIANNDGSARLQLAPLLPNPDTNRAPIPPEIPLPPRISADGGTVFFIHADRDSRGSGVWSVNSDNSNLKLIFNYLDVATQVYGRDGSEYNYNTAFTDGFDINGDGSKIIFGIRTFKIENEDYDRGDAIVADGNTFYKLCDYANGHQPFATNVDDNVYLVFKREYNSDKNYDEINVYFEPLGTGDPVKVLGGLDIFGIASMVQISANGSGAIIQAGNGRLPITFVDRVSQSHLDLVTIDGIGNEIGGFNFSASAYPSINGNGDKFCFLAYSNPPQIWIGDIMSDAVSSEPQISGIQFTPNYVMNDGSTKAAIEAYVTDINHPIQLVTFEAIQDGLIYFRALGAEGGSAFHPKLFDDGTYGDNSAGDNTYTNNTVGIDLSDTPVGKYGVRIAAVNTSLRDVTFADAETFSIVDNATGVNDFSSLPHDYCLYQNYPNPFNPITTIKYSIPVVETRHAPSLQHVHLKVYDALGREVATLVNEYKKAGIYEIEFNAGELNSSVYFYKLTSGNYTETKKMILLK